MFNLVKCILFIHKSPRFRAKCVGEGFPEGLASWWTAFCCLHLSQQKGWHIWQGLVDRLHGRKYPWQISNCFTLSCFSPLLHQREESLTNCLSFSWIFDCWGTFFTSTGYKSPPVTAAVIKYCFPYSFGARKEICYWVSWQVSLCFFTSI